MGNKIYPCFWFDGQAKEAAEFYCATFGDGKITIDSPMLVHFELAGQKFMGLNGGPQFKPNPSISFYVVCSSAAEVDIVWAKLIEGGSALMPLDSYPWSARYGWVQDRFGVSWQLAVGNIEEVGQKYTPLLMFTNDLYSKICAPSALMGIARFEEGEPTPGLIKHAQFKLMNQTFMAMDSPIPHAFNFNEGISLVIDCVDQAEVDHFWDNFTAKGQEGRCGWLNDEFGVSWQVVPRALPQLMMDADPDTAQYAMNALMQMRKIEIDKLRSGSSVTPKTVITVQCTVNAPLSKVWQYWTEPSHIVHWNNASEDWHTPKAENDLSPGGSFVYTMAAKDGSYSFDFSGVFDEVVPPTRLAYTIADGRKVEVDFQSKGELTQIVECFEAENIHSIDLQEAGWQAILDNFKRYVEL
jgi:predicted 3-demethylubiquinone-9 3-methyltransferase (glyoxalase superfamily)/uncharacterized protein YndB with AHSA1/START domain